jgi:CRP-like cAMP-binding protein
VYTKRLRDVPLFAGLGKHELEEVSRLADEIDVAAGQVLARQGDIGHEFFVIEAGKAEVVRDGERVAELAAGDFFGEIALITDERRTATVTASEPMTVIVMTGQSFRGLKLSHPQVYETVHAEVAKRRPVTAA